MIALQGDPDREQVKLLADLLADLVAQGARAIALDFSQISGVASSSLLDVLREAAELLEASGGVLLLSRVASQVEATTDSLACIRGGSSASAAFTPPSTGRSGSGGDEWGRRRGSAL